jgi:hypothetical protein
LKFEVLPFDELIPAVAAVRKLLAEGHRAGVIPSPVEVEFVE